MQQYAPYVPAELIRPYITEYLSQGQLSTLSTLTGLDKRVLHDIRHGKREMVRFPTADKILTGLGLALEWYENEALARYYSMI